MTLFEIVQLGQAECMCSSPLCGDCAENLSKTEQNKNNKKKKTEKEKRSRVLFLYSMLISLSNST